jgi:phage-related protein
MLGMLRDAAVIFFGGILALFARLRIENCKDRMPKTKVILYCEEDGSCPFLEWIEQLPVQGAGEVPSAGGAAPRTGHELRRPEADLLRDGIYELRASLQGVHYRILYFFHGAVAAVVAHGIVKESAVPPKEIDRAIERKKRFEANPAKHRQEESTK